MLQFIIKYNNHVTEGFKCDLTVGVIGYEYRDEKGGRGGAGTSAPYSRGAGFKCPPPKHQSSRVMTFPSFSRHGIPFITRKDVGGPT